MIVAIHLTKYDGLIGKVSAMGSHVFEPRPNQTNNLLNGYLSLPSLALDINRIGQGLVCSVSG